MFDNYRVFHGEFNTNDVLYERPKETCYPLALCLSVCTFLNGKIMQMHKKG